MARQVEGEKGYPWFFFYLNSRWGLSFLVMLVVIGAGAAMYLWYSSTSKDVSPDSIMGFGYAFAGTACLVLAALLFTLQRRSRKRALGKLNSALNWHVCFGIIGLALLFMHSFGNFNPRTGTFALYGMIALVISGFVGRALDHLMPRFITGQVHKALTAEGGDRIESISHTLESIVVHNTQELRSFQTNHLMRGVSNSGIVPQRNGREGVKGKGGAVLQTPWDLAYISIDETPQELDHDAQYRFVPDRKSELSRPGALLPGAREHMSALQDVQRALRQETFLRYVIHYWRIFHIGLSLATVGLTLWHIEYALQLLIPTMLRR